MQPFTSMLHSDHSPHILINCPQLLPLTYTPWSVSRCPLAHHLTFLWYVRELSTWRKPVQSSQWERANSTQSALKARIEPGALALWGSGFTSCGTVPPLYFSRIRIIWCSWITENVGNTHRFGSISGARSRVCFRFLMTFLFSHLTCWVFPAFYFCFTILEASMAVIAVGLQELIPFQISL